MKIFINLILILFISLNSVAQEKANNSKIQNVIIDADTGNEVDDLFAITRAVLEPSWNILALNSTQWQASQWAVANSMENSHRLNQALLSHLPNKNIKICRGSANRMFDWGNKAQHSEASYEIIKQAQKMTEGNKLPVIALGALTNVASAILIEPEIKSKIVVYWLGTSYDFENNKSKTIDFNCVMDIQAVDFMLNSDIEMHIIPVNVAAALTFEYSDVAKELDHQHPACNFLLRRWQDHFDSSQPKRVLWDLGLIQAIIYPGKVKEVKVDGFENKNIWMYKEIDADFFRADFYKNVATLSKK